MLSEFRLTDSEQVLNSVLNFFVNLAFMQNRPESFKNGIGSAWCDVGKDLTTFNHKVSSDFHGVLSRVLKKES